MSSPRPSHHSSSSHLPISKDILDDPPSSPHQQRHHSSSRPWSSFHPYWRRVLPPLTCYDYLLRLLNTVVFMSSIVVFLLVQFLSWGSTASRPWPQLWDESNTVLALQGWSYAIWIPVFAALLVWVVGMLVPRNGDPNPLIHYRVNILYIIATLSLDAALIILVWDGVSPWWAVVAAGISLGCCTSVYVLLRIPFRPASSNQSRVRASRNTWKNYLVVKVPFSVYTGWMLVVTLAAVYYAAGTPDTDRTGMIIGAAVLGGVGVTATVVTGDVGMMVVMAGTLGGSGATPEMSTGMLGACGTVVGVGMMAVIVRWRISKAWRRRRRRKGNKGDQDKARISYAWQDTMW
eukprot:gb/GECH01004812.1/.p1 GENE.gb/GECH01004812.1/~~gb/GECH01004812.1/.p1  ORF type:complete len:347 (+),score=63.97 gb/GECH01004812.1/:1-1041(+)